jgi:hypothetical protein
LEKLGRFLDGTNSLLSLHARGDFWKILPFQVPRNFQVPRLSQIAFKAHSARTQSQRNALDAFAQAPMPSPFLFPRRRRRKPLFGRADTQPIFIALDGRSAVEIIEMARKSLSATSGAAGFSLDLKAGLSYPAHLRGTLYRRHAGE